MHAGEWSRMVDPRPTYHDLAVCAGWPHGIAGYALWNLTAFPFVGARETFRQLRSAKRLADRAGGVLPDAMDGGFRWA